MAIPPLKIQGIKTKIIPKILELAISGRVRFVEPFMGSCVVSMNTPCEKYLLRDKNPYLADFYKALQNSFITVNDIARKLVETDLELKKRGAEYFYETRKHFNVEHDPLDFLVLNRSCFNGLMRFNGKGGFNSPFCNKINRFSKSYITKILNQTKKAADFFKNNDVDIDCADFRETFKLVRENDIVYCDPPYFGRNASYYSQWNEQDENDLLNFLVNGNFGFILSTWHHNAFRTNPLMEKIKQYPGFKIMLFDHFYFIGGRETNRRSVTEALITNIGRKI